ncbi:hypothetical protein [Sinomonas sp. P47F7]|uniref:hypothetical protein n=1 Tax=Sinomonas sp. P47F7 TaxID=3410987 RepID=UPI003BF553F6
MNGTPRTLNRVLVVVFGVLVFAVGVLVVLLSAVPSVGSWWASWAPAASLQVGRDFANTWIPGTSVSWLWLLAMALLVVVILVMIWWMAQQGTGRRDLIAWSASDHGSEETGEAAGRVAISAATVDQALRAALSRRRDILGLSVAAVEFEHRVALRVRVVARQGADPAAIAREIERLTVGMDLLLGASCPVLLHIASGTRARFSRAERVH